MNAHCECADWSEEMLKPFHVWEWFCVARPSPPNDQPTGAPDESGSSPAAVPSPRSSQGEGAAA